MNTMDETSNKTAVSADEEEFGNFFERLGRLVPKLRGPPEDGRIPCGYHSPCTSCELCCESQDLDQSEGFQCGNVSPNGCPVQQQSLNETSNASLDMTSSPIFSEIISNSPFEHNSIHPVPITQSVRNPNINVKFNPRVKVNRSSNNAIKTCRVRNRTAPYRLHKHEVKNDKNTSKNSSSSNNRLPQPYETEAGGRLELLTDVIEYIHNLQSLLENAQSRTLAIASDLDRSSSKFCPEELAAAEPKKKTTHSGKSDYYDLEGTHYPVHGEEADDSLEQASDTMPPPVDQAIKLLDRVVPTAGTQSYRIIEPVVSVDRAMELLEYKTGAITITA